MLGVEFTCPRCLLTETLRPEMRFCPRCGLADAKEAWLDDSPIEIVVGRRVYRVMERIAIGSVCAIYRCKACDSAAMAIFKVARDPCSNPLVLNEAAVLRRLHSIAGAERFLAFIPQVLDNVSLGDSSTSTERQANVLQMHAEIGLPEELYPLGEVRSHFPKGLDARHVAWIWRRLLTVLGFAHSNDVVHSAVLPMHVLIEPREHKLILIDWCTAVAGRGGTQPVQVIAGGYTAWYKRQEALRKPPTPELDLGLGARCMIELLGGDPITGQLPSAVEQGLARYFSRCLSRDSTSGITAWNLLDDFDRLIEALWGPRQFIPLSIPAKRAK